MKKRISALKREIIELENNYTHLLEMGITFSKDKDLDCLLNTILSKAIKITNCEAGSIFLVETILEEDGSEKVLRFKAIQNTRVSEFQLSKCATEYSLPINKKSIAGYVAIIKNIISIDDVYNIDKNKPYKFCEDFDKKIGYKSQSMLAAPIINNREETIGVLELLNRIDNRGFKKPSSALNKKKIYRQTMPFLSQDIEVANWVSGLAGVAVEKIHMLNKLKDQNVTLDQMVKERTHKLNVALGKLEKDMNAAHKMQLDIVPQKERIKLITRTYSLKISSIFKPCNNLGGDFWDIAALDAEKVGILVIDFAGHGIAPSLNTFRIKEFFHSVASKIKSPAMLAEEMNDNIFHNYKMHATCFYVVYNKRNKTLTYSRGGHPYGMWFNQKEDKIVELNSKGIALGFLPDSKYEEKKIILEAGDKVILYTDGIIEARNSNNEFFTEELIKSIILQNKNKSPFAISKHVIKSLSEFTGEVDLDDDVTMIVFEPL